AQFQFWAQYSVDTNGAAVLEYGTPGVLAGLDPLRGQTLPLTQRLLSTTLGALANQRPAIVHAYRFTMSLPDATCAGGLGTLAKRPLFDAVLARDYYSCIAGPMSANLTGHRSFFVNQQGTVMKTLVDCYSGLERVPPAGAALLGTSSPDVITSQELAVNTTGADGQRWAPVN